MAAINIRCLAVLSILAGVSASIVVQTDKGPVAGRWRADADGNAYASFRGVPYAKQPLGELRFQELQPADPWEGTWNATEEGPLCPQHDIVNGNLPYPNRPQSESCIHANIHVPFDALSRRNLKNPDTPIIVFVHGGGFAAGSGDSDIQGPEYLVTKGVIVITFNFRVNIFGFLTLNSPVLPGNNGIRDVLTLLRWVQTNAASFGGNANDVTLAGFSEGANMAHTLSMSPASVGLFHRIIIMSLTASPLFWSTSSGYTKRATDIVLATLGITSTDPEDIHRQLIEMPLDKLMAANTEVETQLGLIGCSPAIDKKSPNFTTIIEKDLDEMIKEGRGNNIPCIMGFATVEGEYLRPPLDAFDIVSKLQQAFQQIVVYPKVAERSTPEVISSLAARIQEKYFPEITLDNYVKYFSDAYLVYPIIKLAKTRAAQAAATTYLYQFSYNNPNNVIRQVKNLTYNGATHMEDQTYWLRVNSALPATQLNQASNEDPMVDRMTSFIANFIKNGAPTDNSEWTPVTSDLLTYYDISGTSNNLLNSPLTGSQQEMYDFFLSIEES